MAITYYASRGYNSGNQGNSVSKNPTGITYLTSRGRIDEEEQNRGGLLGGLGYLGEKMAVGFVSSLEGMSDYTFSGLAKLFGNDAWAEDIIKNDWFGDWYSHPEEWFNPGQGWRVAGDVAGGIGTSIPGMAAAVGLGVATSGVGAGAAASFLTSGLGAAGRATKEAYEQTGKLTGKEYGYGALVGATEGGVEALGNLLSLGSGAVVKSVSKAIGKETAEAFTKQGLIKTLGASFAGEAFEEGLSEILTPYWQRATYDPEAKNATADEVLYSALVGGLSGIVMGGGGYVMESGTNLYKGNKLTLAGRDSEVLDTAGYFSVFEDANQSGDELFSEIASRRKSLLESLQTTGGKAVTLQQKRDLGALERANVAGSMKMFVAKRAQNIVNNAETIAERLTAYGYKTADGKPITFTAAEITEGYDPKKPSSIYKALKNNSKLRELAVTDATGQLMMDTNEFAKATLMGKKLASQVDINRFYEQASREELQAVTDALKIDKWSSLTPEILNQKITDFITEGGVERSIEANEKKAAFNQLSVENLQSLPKYTNMADGSMTRYSDGQIDIGVERKGDSYRTYNYKTGDLSRNLTSEEFNAFLRDYNGKKDQYAAAERQRMEAEQKRKNEIAEIDKLARENIKEYKSLNAPNQSMIRRLIREGRAQGVSDSDVLTYAKISAHSGIDIVFDKNANYMRKNDAGEDVYGDGFYDWKNNRIVVNPESKRSAENLLIHELDHAVRGYFGKDGSRMTTVFKEAIEGVDQATRDKIVREYKKVALPSELASTVMDETNAYYAEKVLTNKNTLEKIVEAEPGLKDKILSFFKGAAADYADTPKLSGSAKWYYKKFKKMFDEFSARNQQSNANENTLTSMNQENMQVSDRRYAGIEEFSTPKNVSWRNVAYDDTETKAKITSELHQKMVDDGLIVKIADETTTKVKESYPYLTGMKKKERLPILKESIKQLKSNLRTFLTQLKGKNFEFKVDGDVLEAKLYNVGIDEVLEKVTQDKAEMLYTTEEIFKNSKYLYSTPDYDGDTNIYRWNYFYTPVQIGDSVVGVRIAIRDMINPQESQIYNWGIKKDTSLDGIGRGTDDRSSYGISSDVSSNGSIPQPEQKSNTSTKKSSKQYALDIDSGGDKIDGKVVKPEKKDGNVAKIKANMLSDKVYNRGEVERAISNVRLFKALRAKDRKLLTDELWVALNDNNRQKERVKATKEILRRYIAMADPTKKVGINQAEIEDLTKNAVSEFSKLMEGGRESYKKKVDNKAKRRIEEGVEGTKVRLKADYTTDKVFSQAAVERGFAKVEAIKKLPKDVRERIAHDLWLELEASDGDDVRSIMPLQYSVELFWEIRKNGEEMTAAQKDKLQGELREAVREIVNSGRDSKWQKQKDNVRGIVKLEERVGAEYKSKIYHNLEKIKDRKYHRFMKAAAYKGDIFKGSIDELKKIDWRGKFSTNIARDQIKKLSEWYTEDNPMFKIEKTGDENSKVRLSTNFSDSIRYMIDMLSEGEGDFTNSELRMLSDVTEYFAKLVDEYDRVYVEGKWQDGEPIAREMLETIMSQENTGIPMIIRALRNKILSAGLRTYGDPLSVMKLADMYGNGIYTRYYNEWMRAEINADAEALRIKAKYDKFMKENPKFLKNAETETIDLHDNQVRKIDLISYAMTLKRKQAWESIAEGGVVFRRYEKGILGKPKVAQEIKIYPTAEIEKGQGYQARLEAAMSAEYDKVMKLLSERDVQYMKVLEEGFELARETKALGDKQRLGFVSVIDGYYYPIKHVDTGHLSEIDLELIATDRYANASFNKQTTERANSAIMITSADATFNSHVKGVSRYLYLSPVMDSFNKLYKLQISKNAEVNADSVIEADGRDDMTTLQRTIAESKTPWRDGKTGVPVGFEYLQNIMLDTMGMGKNVGDDFFSTIRSGSVGFALGANPKVLLTQLSSLISSTSVLTYKSQLGALGIWSGGMDNYSDVARLRNSDYTIAKAEGVVDSVSRFSKVFTSLIGVMDRFVVFRVWAAAQAEVAQNGGPAVGTEENRIKAGKLLDKVILETQQNSLTSRRTEGARRGDVLVKSVQMYKSDAITSFGRVIDGLGEMSYVSALLKSDTLSDAERTKLKDRLDRAKTKFAKAVGSVTVQAMLLLIVNEIFRKLYGKNDDETEEEKRARLLVDGIGNLIGGMPIVSEVYSVFTSNFGFEPMELSAVNDFFDTAKSVINYVNRSSEGEITDRDTNKMVRTVLFSGGQLLGIPLRNIRNLIYGSVRLFDKDAAYKWDNAVYKKNYSADLTKALENDDIERATMIMELALGEKMGSGFSDASIRELASLVSLGEKVIPSAISDTITIDGEEYALEAEQYAAVKQVYSGVIAAVNSLVESKAYKSHTAEQKAKVLRKLYATYKDIAYDRALGTQRNVRANIISSLLSENTFNSYIALSAIESDVDAEGNTISGSKRRKVVQAISSLGVSVEERLLLICASGYALKDGDVRGLSAEGAKKRILKYILTYKGLSGNERLSLAEMCGFEVKNGRIVNNFSKNLKKLSKKMSLLRPKRVKFVL